MTDGNLLRNDAGVLHAPWRLVLFLLAAGALILLVSAIAAPVVASLEAPLAQMGAAAIVLSVALTAAHMFAFRLGRWGSWSRVGLGLGAAHPRTLATGTAVGILAIALPSLLVLALGWYRLEPGSEGSVSLTALQVALVLLPAAFWEELLARGYLFATIRERWGAPAALVMTSVGFGLLHLGNAGANFQAVLQVTFAGFWLGGILLATGSLYAAWLAHAAWNWTIAAMLHAPVSGIPFATPGWELRDAGPEWATGGAWGPEGSVFALVTMTLTLAYLFVRRARRRES